MDLTRLLSQNLPSVLFDTLRLAVWFILLLGIFAVLEKLFALRRERIFRRDFGADMAYYFLGGLIPKLLLILPMSAVAWLLHGVIPAGLHGWVASLPFGVRLMAALVVGEIGFYWGHRWMHEIPLLWRFHAIHHSPGHIDWLVNTRAHPLDVTFTRLCGFVPMYVVGLAQPLINDRLDPVPVLVLLVGSCWGYFIHANLRWRFGWLEHVISTPAFHHWHHTNDHRRDHNYASMLPWMDRIFGTYTMPKHEWPATYGIDSTLAPGVVGQLLDPLRPARKSGDPSMPGAPVKG